jgi:hypothetical protein
MVPKFEILTENSVLDDWSDYDQDEAMNILFEQQQDALRENGFGEYYDGVLYFIHFFDSQWFNDHTELLSISEAVERLAIKDGADFVEYIYDGTYGYVAYYNGEVNGFEILAESSLDGLNWCYENGYITNDQYDEYSDYI